MANAEYKFTNKNADIRGRVAEVIEFAKQRGIFIGQMRVFKDADALKNEETSHQIFDVPEVECEEDGCGDTCCCAHTPDNTLPSEEEVYENLRELFAKVFGFDE